MILKQKTFPFQIPDSVLLDVVYQVHESKKQAVPIQELFCSAMDLLGKNSAIHFGDLAFSLPDNHNGNSGHHVISCRGGEVYQHEKTNPFLAHALNLCENIKKPEIVQINSFDKLCDESFLPYCPSVISLGVNGCNFGVLAVGSYDDREVVRRNIKLFEVLGLELSLSLHMSYLNKMVEDFLFSRNNGEAISFETILAYRFQKLLGKADGDECRNLLSNVLGVVEKIMITLALEKAENRIGEAASILGINRNTLRKKIRLLELDSQS
jgi:DNA-binding protein Fis